MLKKRLIAVLTVRQGIVVQSIGFRRYLPVGKPEIAVEFLNQWGIDEIVLLDITASAEHRTVDRELVRRASQKCYVPLTVGGGVRTTEDFKALISSGADKVAVNASALERPQLISEAADMFGNQAVIVAIDARRIGEGAYEVFAASARRRTGLDPAEHARECVRLGAGEIFLVAADRDGLKTGFDLELAAQVGGAVDAPLILCGGAGHPRHFVEALQAESTSAVAAGNYFHFTEHSAVVAKSYARAHCKQPIRMDTYASYADRCADRGFDEDGRLARKTDSELAELFFEHHPKEVI